MNITHKKEQKQKYIYYSKDGKALYKLMNNTTEKPWKT